MANRLRQSNFIKERRRKNFAREYSIEGSKGYAENDKQELWVRNRP
jgi:hypothetical protein